MLPGFCIPMVTASGPSTLPNTTVWYTSGGSSAHTLFSNSDRTVKGDGDTQASARSVTSHATGKWVFECTVDVDNAFTDVGIGTAAPADGDFAGSNATDWGYADTDQTFHSGTPTSAPSFAATGTVVTVAIDIDAGKLWFAKDGVWLSGDPSAGSSPSYTSVTGTLFALATVNSVTDSITLNTTILYPPSGFSAWA